MGGFFFPNFPPLLPKGFFFGHQILPKSKRVQKRRKKCPPVSDAADPLRSHLETDGVLETEAPRHHPKEATHLSMTAAAGAASLPGSL